MTKFNITKEEKLKDLIGYVHKIRMKRFKGLSGYQMRRLFNFIRTNNVDRFLWQYFYALFIYKGDRVERVLDIRIAELYHRRKRGLSGYQMIKIRNWQEVITLDEVFILWQKVVWPGNNITFGDFCEAMKDRNYFIC